VALTDEPFRRYELAQEKATMQARMKNPALVVPDALKAILAVSATVNKVAGVPARTHHLVHLRVSQINGCGLCVDMHAHDAKKDGDTDQRIFAVAAWRDSPYFTDAERAALALAESATRLSDQPDPVPDHVWNEATKHYDEQAISALVLSVATINLWNRINVTTRQVAGSMR
jgi:AhpD family alkylhydroperoxidase